MKTRNLRTLLAISSAGSFSGAARTLNMTLPAVSMQIKTLEESLGVLLFDRKCRPPRMTAEARALLPPARALLDAERALLHAARPDAVLSGVIRVGFIPTASMRLLPPFLERAAEGAPEAEFEITSGLSRDLMQQVAAGKIDAAVLTRPEETAALTQNLIATEDLAFAVPAGFETVSLARLPQHLPFLQFLPHSGIGALISAWLNARGMVPERRIVLDSAEPIAECLARGLGYTILPRPDLARYRDRGFIVRALPAPGLARDVVLVTANPGMSASRRRQLLSLLRPGETGGAADGAADGAAGVD